jgi:YD repeat-containing protein
MRTWARGWAVGTVLAASGCAMTLPESAWVTERPRGECVVEIERSDARSAWTVDHQHAADGRLLSGSAQLRYHGEAWERFGYGPDGRLAEIASYEEIAAESFPCAAEGGCDTPRLRWVARTRLEHDAAGRLRRYRAEMRTYELRPDGSYGSRTGEDRDLRYGYDASGRLTEIRSDMGTTRFTWDGERLVRVEAEAEYPWFDVLEHDAEGRIARVQHSNCTPARECNVSYELRYEYDAEGRLVRRERTRDSTPARIVRTWEYEGARVVGRSEVQFYPATEQRREREYRYDARGRLIEVLEDGTTRERRRYLPHRPLPAGGAEGACDAVVSGPAPPSALADVGARPCVRSPAYVLDECWEP